MAAPQEIEALYVSLSLDDKKFVDPAQVIERQIESLNAKLAGIGEGAANSFSKLVAPLHHLSKTIEALQAANIEKVSKAIEGMAPALDKLSHVGSPPSLKAFAGSLPELVESLSALGGTSRLSQGLGQAGQKMVRIITELAPALKELASIPTFPNMAPFSKALGEFNVAIDPLIGKIGDIGTLAAGINNFRRIVNRLSTEIVVPSTYLRDFANDLGRISNLLGSSGLRSGFQKLMQDMSQLPTVSVPSVKGLVIELTDIATALHNLSQQSQSLNFGQSLGGLSQHLQGLRQVSGGTVVITASLDALSASLTRFSLRAQQIGSLLPNLQSFTLWVSTFQQAVARLSSVNVNNLSTLLQQLATFNVGPKKNVVNLANSLGSLAANINNLGSVNYSNAVNNVTSLVAFLGGIDVSGLRGLQRMMADLVRFFNVPLPSAGKMQSMIRFIEGLVATLGTLSDREVVNAGRIGRALSMMTTSMIRFGRVDMSRVVVNGKMFQAWLYQFTRSLGGLSDGAVNNARKLGLAMFGIGRMLKEANRFNTVLPHITNNVKNFHRAAGGAGGGIGRFNTGLLDLFRSGLSANASLTTLRYSLMGFVGFGVGLFAKFDDALTRTMAHMRDWQRTTEGAFTAGINAITSRSTTGRTDLAKGLDILASSGQSAGMAIKSLAIAETFAVASGMQMEDATKKLVQIQRSLGMFSEDTAKHYANMTHLSNLFVGMAPMVGSTSRQLMEAFGSRFVSSMKMANMTLEEGIALLGTYSIRGIQGAEASDHAARALLELGRRSVDNIWRWKRLGVEVYDAAGQMRKLPDILEDLEGRFEGMTHMQRTATLALMGFEQRTISAVLPLVGMGKAMRELQEETGKVGEVADRTAQMMRQSFLGQLKVLWNLVSNIAVEIGKVLAPAIAWLARGIESLSKWFMSLNPVVRQVIIAVGLLAATSGIILSALTAIAGLVIGPIMTAYAVISAIVGFVIANFAVIVGVLGAVIYLIPLMLVAAGLFAAVVIAGWDVIVDLTKQIVRWFKEIDWNEMAASAKRAITNVIGFFYNLGENIERMTSWMERNWKEVLEDMLKATAVFAGNVGHNVGILLLTIGENFATFGSWLLRQWHNIATDLGTIIRGAVIVIAGLFNGLAGAVGIGFERIFDYIKKEAINMTIFVLNRMFALMAALPGMGPAPAPIPALPNARPTTALLLKDAQRGIEFGVRAAIRDMGGLGALKFHTDIRDLQKEINNDWKNNMTLLRNVMEDFVPSVKEAFPELNFFLPEDFFDNLEEKLLRNFSPFTAPGEEMGSLAGKQGPGFQFKQISMERTMVSGPAAESLDYQQLVTLKIIADRLTTMIAISKGGNPMIPKEPTWPFLLGQ